MNLRRALVTVLLVCLLAGCNLPMFTATPETGGQIVARGYMPSPTNFPPTVPTLPPVNTLTPFQPATLAVTFTVAPSQTMMPTLTFIPTFTSTPTITRTPKPRLSLGDLHMHTTCSDGRNTYDEMVTAAVERGYQFIAITDHHVCPEIIQACQQEERLVCFPAQEVPSLERLEVLSIGTTRQFPDYLTIKQIVNLSHDWGGIAIAAHPWSLEGTWTEWQLLHNGLDAMECRRYGEQTMPFDTSSLPCVYDSDAHDTGTLHDPMECTGAIRNLSDLKSAILNGQCKPPN